MSDEGTYADADEFTALDRELLSDHHGREVKRETTYIGGGIVRAYEKREVFTFTHPEIGDIRFDVRSIKNALLDGRLRPDVYKVAIDPQFYEHVLANNGVEPDRLPTLTDRDLQRPGIMIGWPDGHSTLIDGNHRLCATYQRGVWTFRFLLVSVRDALPFMCLPGDEEKLFADVRDEDAVTLSTEVRIED